jgi:predicted negative regulator of RcsB-dependent stress response
MKKLVLVIVALIVVAVGAVGWKTYQNKRTFEAVMAEHQKTAPAQR